MRTSMSKSGHITPCPRPAMSCHVIIKYHHLDISLTWWQTRTSDPDALNGRWGGEGETPEKFPIKLDHAQEG